MSDEINDLTHVEPDPKLHPDARWGAVIVKCNNYGFARMLREFSAGETRAMISARIGIHPSSLTRYTQFGKDGEMGPEEQVKQAERHRMWGEGRKAAAESFSEKALDTAEAAPDTAVGVQKARLKVDTYKWRAAVLNPDEFALNRQGQVQINLGDSFLESLRRRTVRPSPQPTPALESGEPDYEVG
jgi:hypothetical protein